jgi:uncharacterized membrane protein
MSSVKPMHRNLLYVLAILFLISGIFGYLEIKNNTYDGYSSQDFTVTKVEANSPAATAGMQVGDQIKTVNGLNVRDSETWANMSRAKVGETRTYVADRAGEEVSFDLTYAAAKSRDSILSRIGWTIGLIFLLMGLWAFRSKEKWASFLFAMFTLGFAGSFMGGPYLGNGMMGDLVGTLRFCFVLLSFAFLVDFLLNYPKKSSFIESTKANKIIYWPAIFLCVFFLAITLLQLDSTSGLNTFIQFAMLIFVVGFFGWALVILFNNFRSNNENDSRVNLMFWGSVIGLVPILIGFISNNLLPGTELPGEDYYFLTMAAIPICFAKAIQDS